MHDPQPVSTALEEHFRKEAAAIPFGKRGQISAAITTIGVGLGGAFKVGSWRRAEPVVTGWAGRTWGGEGWSAGARIAVVF